MKINKKNIRPKLSYKLTSQETIEFKRLIYNPIMIASLTLENNEFARIKALAEYNLDYANLQDEFEHLIRMAQVSSGMPIAFINLIEAESLWITAACGLGTGCIGKEDSVCQYTILEKTDLEIKDLSADARTCNLVPIKLMGLKYYYGVPITTNSGSNIGSVCVFDTQAHTLDELPKEMLQLVAKEVSIRLDALKQLDLYKSKIALLEKNKAILAHDIRGPLSGIMGLADVALDEAEETSTDELLDYLSLIKQSSSSVLDLANEILQEHRQSSATHESLTTLLQLKEKIQGLFAARVKDKNIALDIFISKNTEHVTIAKDNLQQIIGNLVSNAIKFTSQGGFIAIDLNLLLGSDALKHLTIRVTDSGLGMNQQTRDAILTGDIASTDGTGGETGYGLGLQLVKHLVAEKKGSFDISSELGQGSCFTIVLPVN